MYLYPQNLKANIFQFMIMYTVREGIASLMCCDWN